MSTLLDRLVEIHNVCFCCLSFLPPTPQHTHTHTRLALHTLKTLHTRKTLHTLKTMHTLLGMGSTTLVVSEVFLRLSNQNSPQRVNEVVKQTTKADKKDTC